MSTIEESHEVCDICKQVTCYCCRRITIRSCCNHIICIFCVLQHSYICCSTCWKIIFECPSCSKLCIIPKKIINKYIKHAMISKDEFYKKLQYFNEK